LKEKFLVIHFHTFKSHPKFSTSKCTKKHTHQNDLMSSRAKQTKETSLKQY
jgi:hypothetical protein